MLFLRQLPPTPFSPHLKVLLPRPQILLRIESGTSRPRIALTILPLVVQFIQKNLLRRGERSHVPGGSEGGGLGLLEHFVVVWFVVVVGGGVGGVGVGVGVAHLGGYVELLVYVGGSGSREGLFFV